mmetsp:Transcript_39130/g.122398  ORF Transcript_39130/g.122398 Transcript_39130/m.122398 type:complete len:253 (-) Transcript_39130:88-846(-)
MISRTSKLIESQITESLRLTPKGFSIMSPISWMPNRAQVTSVMSGTVQSPSSPTSTKGRVRHHMLRKRLVWRAYMSGTGVCTRRSAAPTRWPRLLSMFSSDRRSRLLKAWPGSSSAEPTSWSGTIASAAESLLMMYMGRLRASASARFSFFSRDRYLEAGRPVRCSRSTQGKAQSMRPSRRSRSTSMKGACTAAMRVRSRTSSWIPCQILRPSQKRWYAAFVRNTSSRPSAPLSRWCGLVLGEPKPVSSSRP